MAVPSSPAFQMIGRSPAIEGIDAEIGCAAASEARVLITGEAGTGKGLIARLIHRRGPRAAAPFSVVDCGAVVAAELTTWLFGQTGTVLLDGATEMPRPIQDRLFAALDTGPSVRLLVATRCDLHVAVAAGEFREDLFYRLNVMHVAVPPLRHRVEDLPLLVDHFLDVHAARTGRPRLRVGSGVIDTLTAHSWPGNVRELRQVIDQAAQRAAGPTLEIADLPPRLSGGVQAPFVHEAEA